MLISFKYIAFETGRLFPTNGRFGGMQLLVRLARKKNGQRGTELIIPTRRTHRRQF
jgi:hypothetical protein